ncbi:hypothetical protein [Demequina sediminicola]|uniref:hypothetical protein n=1 Tax=Demequina sediminicola TaxID=1095026 RepID=UPI00078269B9|nr:hypothetical protein [Demequina sediminicola]
MQIVNLGVSVVLVMALAACTSRAETADSGGGSELACAAMYVSVSESEVRAGDSVDVTVENIDDECLDTGESSTPHEPAAYELIFDQNENGVDLVTFTADDGPTAEFSVTIPESATPGAATIGVEFAEKANIVIVP